MSHPQRLMTVMFADVAGSARLYERLGDIEANYAVDRCMKRISRCIEASRGRSLQLTGDELLAAFDSAEDACLAAIEMQARIADLPPVSGLKLTIRIGLHVGMVTEAAGNISGMPVISAARITGLAAKDQILASERVLAELPESLAKSARLQTSLEPISEGGSRYQIYEFPWLRPHENFKDNPSDKQQLFLFYRDKCFKLDKDSPVFTLGREPDSSLLIEDRKASRKHARIEYRPSGFFYVDRSTNGSFVSFSGNTESLLRQDEIHLHADGRICFGSSGNDPKSDFITFEYR